MVQGGLKLTRNVCHVQVEFLEDLPAMDSAEMEDLYRHFLVDEMPEVNRATCQFVQLFLFGVVFTSKLLPKFVGARLLGGRILTVRIGLRRAFRIFL